MSHGARIKCCWFSISLKKFLNKKKYILKLAAEAHWHSSCYIIPRMRVRVQLGAKDKQINLRQAKCFSLGCIGFLGSLGFLSFLGFLCFQGFLSFLGFLGFLVFLGLGFQGFLDFLCFLSSIVGFPGFLECLGFLGSNVGFPGFLGCLGFLGSNLSFQGLLCFLCLTFQKQFMKQIKGQGPVLWVNSMRLCYKTFYPRNSVP
jgi:hypothetical protein